LGVAPAKEYSAGCEAVGVDGALIVDLIGTAAGPLDFRFSILDFRFKVNQFRWGNIEPMAVGIEIAAVAAGVAVFSRES
jgi:hypothetical protein